MKFLYFIVLVSLFSCTKVIDIDTNQAELKYVIEGTITKDSTSHYVRVTKTQDFQSSDEFPEIDNALITVTDNDGFSASFTYENNGWYKLENYTAFEGKTYTLKVIIGSEEFTATSTIPSQVIIDSLTLEEFSFGPEPAFALVANRLDPINIKNYYFFNLYRGKEKAKGLFLQDDQFADGKEIKQPIFGFDYKSGDTAYLEMMCIDSLNYKYFTALSQNLGGSTGAVPANPNSGFGSTALGYFSAQTFQRLMKIIP